MICAVVKKITPYYLKKQDGPESSRPQRSTSLYVTVDIRFFLLRSKQIRI